MANDPLAAALRPLIDRFSGRTSLALYRFSDDMQYHHRSETTMPAASLIKLPILCAALAEVEAGRLSLEQRVRVTADDTVGGSGVLHALHPGVELSLYDLLTLMIVVSDNTATNMVIDLVGQDAINDWCEAHSLVHTELVGKLQLPDAKQNEAQRRGERNATCAAEMLRLLVRLQRGRLLPDETTTTALEIMKKQQFHEAMGRYLPRDGGLEPSPITLASKSGCLRGVWHDAGIVYRNGEPLYALVVMTTDARDTSFGVEQEGVMLIAKLSEQVFALLR
ncbi:MAG: serine hydrolase [Trueperaceae bacterium]|nr:serine hydrolase [Trueperaceae bacterium]